MVNYGLKLGSLKKLGYLVPRVELCLEKDWTPYLPLYEPQYGDGWDTYGCTVWGTENAIETVLKRITGKEYNLSERFVYILENIHPPGHDPYLVAECIEKNGVVENSTLPMTSSYQDFIQPNPLPQYIVDEAKKFKEKYDFRHEPIFPVGATLEEKDKIIDEVLKYSPIGVSLYAWALDSNGLYYRPNNQSDTHWCLLVNRTKDFDVVFDSYNQEIKHVRRDMNYGYAERYYVGLKSQKFSWGSWWNSIIAIIKKQFNIFKYFYEK